MLYVIDDDQLINALIKGTSYEKFYDMPDELIWKTVYPYLRLDGTQEETTCNLLFEVNEYEYTRNNLAYKEMELVISVLCHTDLMKYVDGTRTDYISGRLDYLFNKNPDFGGGLLTLKSNIAYVLQGGSYHYRTLIFNVKDSNSSRC